MFVHYVPVIHIHNEIALMAPEQVNIDSNSNVISKVN